MPAKSAGKFKPIAGIERVTVAPGKVVGRVPRGSSILIIQRPWIDLILNGVKTKEVRNSACFKDGERIFLALSGGGGIILGEVDFVRSRGPLSRRLRPTSATSKGPYSGTTQQPPKLPKSTRGMRSRWDGTCEWQ